MNDIVMIPWKHSCAEKSINFLINKGFSVMASSQEQEGDISIAPLWAKVLRDNFKNRDMLYGLMHAPWKYDYASHDGLERMKTAADKGLTYRGLYFQKHFDLKKDQEFAN